MLLKSIGKVVLLASGLSAVGSPAQAGLFRCGGGGGFGACSSGYSYGYPQYATCGYSYAQPYYCEPQPYYGYSQPYCDYGQGCYVYPQPYYGYPAPSPYGGYGGYGDGMPLGPDQSVTGVPAGSNPLELQVDKHEKQIGKLREDVDKLKKPAQGANP